MDCVGQVWLGSQTGAGVLDEDRRTPIWRIHVDNLSKYGLLLSLLPSILVSHFSQSNKHLNLSHLSSIIHLLRRLLL